MEEQYFRVIMPVGSDLEAPEKQRLLQQAARAHNLVAHLPTYDPIQPSFDIHSELKDLKESLFVIADLSLERPSCYYELGVAEAVGKKVHLIAQEGTAIHQTVNRKDVRFYRDKNHLKTLIEGIIQDATQ